MAASRTACYPGANICEKVPGTDRSGEALRAQIGGVFLGRGQLAPPHQLRDLGSAVSSTSGVWGGAPDAIEFGAFSLKI